MDFRSIKWSLSDGKSAFHGEWLEKLTIHHLPHKSFHKVLELLEDGLHKGCNVLRLDWHIDEGRPVISDITPLGAVLPLERSHNYIYINKVPYLKHRLLELDDSLLKLDSVERMEWIFNKLIQMVCEMNRIYVTTAFKFENDYTDGVEYKERPQDVGKNIRQTSEATEWRRLVCADEFISSNLKSRVRSSAHGGADGVKYSESTKKYRQYLATPDSRTRASHKVLDRRIFSIDDPIWGIIMPNPRVGCRCTTRDLTIEEVKQLGIPIEMGTSIPEIMKQADEKARIQRKKESRVKKLEKTETKAAIEKADITEKDGLTLGKVLSTAGDMVADILSPKEAYAKEIPITSEERRETDQRLRKAIFNLGTTVEHYKNSSKNSQIILLNEAILYKKVLEKSYSKIDLLGDQKVKKADIEQLEQLIKVTTDQATDAEKNAIGWGHSEKLIKVSPRLKREMYNTFAQMGTLAATHLLIKSFNIKNADVKDETINTLQVQNRTTPLSYINTAINGFKMTDKSFQKENSEEAFKKAESDCWRQFTTPSYLREHHEEVGEILTKDLLENYIKGVESLKYDYTYHGKMTKEEFDNFNKIKSVTARYLMGNDSQLDQKIVIEYFLKTDLGLEMTSALFADLAKAANVEKEDNRVIRFISEQIIPKGYDLTTSYVATASETLLSSFGGKAAHSLASAGPNLVMSLVYDPTKALTAFKRSETWEQLKTRDGFDINKETGILYITHIQEYFIKIDQYRYRYKK